MPSPDTTPPADASTRKQLRAQRRAEKAAASDSAAFAAAALFPAESDAAESASTVSDASQADTAHAEATEPRDAQADATADDLDAVLPAAPAQWATAGATPTALPWVDAETIAARTGPAGLSDAAPVDRAAPSLLAGGPRRSPVRWAALTPVLLAGGLAAAYAITMAVWPLHEVAPEITASPVAVEAAAASALVWPETGTSGVSVTGVGRTASTTEAAPIASITKVVSSLMVLDRVPLALGEQGPSYSFPQSAANQHTQYLNRNESALAVPTGGSLTLYQMLQGTLIGSANNYIDRLAREVWGSDREFAQAAEIWLSARGLTGTRIVEPTGIDPANRSTPDDLTRLAEIAMANPVIREIVGTAVVVLPGADEVVNTNPLLGSDGVNGIKTGLLRGDWNLLSSKEATIGDTTVLLTAAVLGQEDSDQRSAATVSLFAQVEEELRTQPVSVPAGTEVGEVTTLWGAGSPVVTAEDARVVLWNGAAATTAVTELRLGDTRGARGRVGTLTVTGPVDSIGVDLVLATTVDDPDFWWRLTHPLDLLGLTP